jgi:DNA replication protein DnaC
MYDKKLYETQLTNTFGTDYDNACLSKYVLPDDYLIRISNWVKFPSGLLYFAGNPGLGKTYFSVAFCKLLINRKKNFRCFTEKSFMSHLKYKMGNENIDPEYEIKRLCEVEYFVLDDVAGSEQMTDWQKDIFYSFVDHRVSNNLPTLITSNLYSDDLSRKFQNPRLLSRLKASKNVFIELHWIDKRIENFE